MNSPREVDLLVVGLGPGGASAALSAAGAGLKVLGVDKKIHPGEPVQCAEFVPRPMTGDAQVRAAHIQDIRGMRTFHPRDCTTFTEHFPGLMIDRRRLDAGIAARAVECGAELRYATRLIRLDAEAGEADLQGPRGEERIRFRLLIAADGPRSPTARLLGLTELRHVFTRQYTVPLQRPFATTDIWLSADYPGGYAWLFPKGEVANLGLGLDKRFSQDLKTPLDELHRRLVEEGRVGMEILGRTGGEIPVQGLRDRLVWGERILFVGDAAGLTHPITGAGIAPAMLAGELAGVAVAEYLAGDADALVEYEEELRDRYQASLGRAVAKRVLLEERFQQGLPPDPHLFRATWIAFDEYHRDDAA